MIKKLLARFGKGAATVDLRFDTSRPYYAGSVIEGEVHVYGGAVEQKVNSLSARLMINVRTSKSSATREAAVIPLIGSFFIRPKEEKVIPFTYQIPANLPVSRGSISYYFDTILDIEGGVDRTDVDYFTIDVPQKMQPIFQAMADLGFREKHTSGKLDKYGQEFSFFPTGLFAGQVNEVELRLANEETGVRVWMEVDCKHGLQEIEAKRELFFDHADLENATTAAEKLKEAITEMVEQPQAYSQPFSFTNYPHYSHGQHGGSGIAGMVGGLAMGLLGGMLLGELMEDLIGEEMFEGTMEELGLDEDFAFEDALDFEDEGADDGGFDFGDFFGGGDDEF